MEYISLSQAAILIGKSKSTVLEYVRNGKLKADKNEKGIYNISKDDLFLAFSSNGTERTDRQLSERHLDVAILQEKLASEQVLRKSIENERDFLREQLKEAGAERRMLNNKLSLLEGNHTETDFEPIIVAAEKPKKANSLWQKIFKK
jgi:hypothetical protein